jgi:nitrile hydratase accessory protein
VTLSRVLSPSDPPSKTRPLPRQPRDAGEPVFAEPWQAQAFAVAIKLSEAGWFTWVEWAAALAVEIKAADAADAKAGRAPDDGTRYYEHWLSALEKLVAAKGLAEEAAIQVRKEEWAEAYRRTPHGQPVELRVGQEARRRRAASRE